MCTRTRPGGGTIPAVLAPLAPLVLAGALAPDATALQGLDLFDESVIRTLRLDFTDPDWPNVLNPGSYVPTGDTSIATATLGGLSQFGSEVQYGGGLTYFTAMTTANPWNLNTFPLEVEFPDEIGDFDELRLKNGLSDVAHLRKVLAMRIFRRHTLAPRTAYMGVEAGPLPTGMPVLPGVTQPDPGSLGLYLHLEHLDKRFVQRNFDAEDGFRFEFVYLDDDPFLPPALPGGITLLGSAADQAWDCSGGDCPQQLVLDIVDAMNDEAPGTAAFRQQMSEALDVDSYLWFVAGWLAIQDWDSRQSKFVEDRENSRLVAVPQDTNLSFDPGEVDQSIAPPTLKGDLTTILVQDPRFALRYLHHLRHVVRDTIQPGLWSGLGAVYVDLLADTTDGRDTPLMTNSNLSLVDVASAEPLIPAALEVANNTTAIQSNFALVADALTARHDELVADPVLNRTELSIPFVDTFPFADAGAPIPIQAQVIVPPGMAEVTLFWRTTGAYQPLPMVDDGTGDDAVAGDLVHTATLPAQAAGTDVEYYVEALFLLDPVTWPDVFDPACPSSATYFPVAAEHAPLRTHVTDAWHTTPIVINEFLVGDGGGDTNEWVELYNAGDYDVQISTWRVDDDPFGTNLDPTDADNHVVPGGTVLAPGEFYLVPTNQGGVFDLNHKHGFLALRDHQDRLIDVHEYRRQTEHLSQGRLHDGAGPFVTFATPSPGASNGTPADMNADGTVNTGDLLVLLGQVGQFGLDLPGDLNGDWVIDHLDVAILTDVMNP